MNEKFTLSLSGKLVRHVLALLSGFMIAMGAQAQNAPELQQKITIGFKDTEVVSAINQIKSKTSVKISFNSNDLTNAGKVTIVSKERTVEELLNYIVKQTNLEIKYDKDIVMLRPQTKASGNDPKDNINIKGKVVSDQGEELPGVNISVKNTGIGTSTNGNGEFTLNHVPSNATIIASFIGFETQEVAVNGRKELVIKLKTEAKGLEEVVVVGYGTQRKRDVVGAVSSVNVKNMEKLTGGDVGTMLQGQAAGVMVAPGSGDPGAAPIIRVRGLSTIGNNDPLYVIDGIPGDINSVNPNDIQSIDVLKDASAATIYGSRASNGVIQVTTKRGTDGKIKVNVNSYYGVNQLSKRLPITNQSQYNQIMLQTQKNDGEAPLDYTASNTYVDGNGQTQAYPNTDWQDEFFQAAPESKIDLSLSGGSKDLKMNVSLGRYDQKGIVINTNFQKYNVQVNTDITKGKFKFGESMTFLSSDRRMLEGSNESTANQQNAGYPLIYEMINRVPQFPVYNSENDGGFGGRIGTEMIDATNPVGIQTLVDNSEQRTSLIGNIYGEYQILQPLSFRLQYGINLDDSYAYSHIPTYYMGAKVQNPNAQLYEGRSKYNRSILNAVLTFNKTFNNVHALNALAGYSQESDRLRSLSGSNNDLPSNDLWALNSGLGDKSSGGTLVESSLISWFARANYAYNDKYLLAATVRVDGSSRFAPSYKYGTFYSFSGAWRVSSEKFFQSSVINDLKIRAGYGTLGNQSIPNYQYLPPVINAGNDAVNYPLGTGIRQKIFTGGIVTSASAPDIKWEESATFNAGVDLSVLNEKLTFVVDVFKTRTSDMLVTVPLPLSGGLLFNPYKNAAEMENKGIDMALSYRGTAGKLKFDVTGNFTLNRNKVTKLGFAGESFTDGYMDFNNFPTTRTEVGGEIGRFYLYKTAGVIKTQQDLDAVKAYQPNAQLGDVKFVDTNGDGELNDNDRIFMGSGLPKFEYGLTTNLSLGRFDMSMLFQGAQGNKIYNGAKRLMYQNTIHNKSTDLLDAWTPENPNSDIPRTTVQDPNGNNSLPSDRFLENGSYFRLKSIQIGYKVKLPQLNSLRVYAGATNVFTITKYTGYDPGIVNYSTFARGVDRGLYPLSRSFFAGLSFDF
ncbi:TonB dependent receptor [compost metagenome]